MRIYQSVREAIFETERELLEMGIDFQSYSYQDKIVNENDDFMTKELQSYGFQIIAPDPEEAITVSKFILGDKIEPWIRAEFEERVGGLPLNPGKSWELRKNIWEQFLESSGKFSYTYSQLMFSQIKPIINELREHPHTRQAIIELHNNIYDLPKLGGKRRIPCSMHYQFMIRNGGMDCIYVMRSSSFYEHTTNDVTLAIMLQNYIREQVDPALKQGVFTFHCGSLHAFKKQLIGIF